MCRLTYSSKSSTDVPVRSNNAGPNTPDLEIAIFPLVIAGFNVQTPQGIYGATLVRQASLSKFRTYRLTSQGPIVLKPESSGTITINSASVYDQPVIDPKYEAQYARCPRVVLTSDHNSFFSSENDLNVLVRGVRFTMRVCRTERVKGILEPKADSVDKKDFFYMSDADPDRVCTHTITPPPYCNPHLTTDYGRGDQRIHPQPLQRRVPPCASRPSYPPSLLIAPFPPLPSSYELTAKFCRRPPHASALPLRLASSTLTYACSASRVSALPMHPCSQTRSVGTLSRPLSLSPKRRPTLSNRVRKPEEKRVGDSEGIPPRVFGNLSQRITYLSYRHRHLCCFLLCIFHSFYMC